MRSLLMVKCYDLAGMPPLDTTKDIYRQILWRAKEDFYLLVRMMVHAESLLLKVKVVSDAQCTGMEVAIWMAWLREPHEGQEHQQNKEVGQRTTNERLPALASGLPYICERK